MEVGGDAAARAAARVRIETLDRRRGQTGRGGRHVVHVAVVGVAALVGAGAVLLDDLRVALLQRLRIVQVDVLDECVGGLVLEEVFERRHGTGYVTVGVRGVK